LLRKVVVLPSALVIARRYKLWLTPFKNSIKAKRIWKLSMSPMPVP